MFGTKRRRAVRAAVNNLKPIIGIIQYNYGIPAGFWQDDYVVGYFGFMIGFYMQMASGGALSKAEKGQGLAEAFTELSHINGVTITRQFTTLCFAETDEFKEGADNAALIALYTAGQLKNEDDNEHVRQAKQIAEKMGAGSDRIKVAGILVHNLCINEIVKRFNAEEGRAAETFGS